MQLPVDAAPAAVMAAVIAAWGQLRHPRLAELVDQIEDQLLAASPRPPLRATKRRLDPAWREIEAAGDPLDFRRLGAAIGGSRAVVLSLVEVLAARRDPRLARVLLALLENPPYFGPTSRELLGAILEQLAATRDRRAAGPAADLADRYVGIVSTGTGRWMVNRLRAVARRLEVAEHAKLTGALAAACVTLEARFGVRGPDPEAAAAHRTLGELLADVHAALDDDGPRLVYADALLEQGDPRGELITLQIARARGTITDEGRAREAELLADKARLAAWTQPLWASGECTFERGFPVAIRLYRRAKAATGAAAWATITGVTELSQVSPAVQAQICALPNLRSVEFLAVPLLEELCRTPRPWTRVGAEGPRAPSAETLAALPDLRTLVLRIDEAPPRDRLARLPLRELLLEVGRPCEVLDLPPELERLHVSSRGAPPRMELARLAHLEELCLHYREAAGPLALPPSLNQLELHGFEAPLPCLSIAGPPAVRGAQLHARELAADALRELASLETLYLRTLQLPTGALDALARLRTLSIVTRDALPPSAFARLAKLEELAVHAAYTPEPGLDGLPIRSLWWYGQPLDSFPAGLPLVRASVSAYGDPDPLERFLARYPALAHLDVDVLPRVPLAPPTDTARWRRLVEILERSSLRVCAVGPSYEAITLERDAEGLLSRVRLARTTAVAVEILVRSLTRVTSIACDAGKVPPKLARLVR